MDLTKILIETSERRVSKVQSRVSADVGETGTFGESIRSYGDWFASGRSFE